MIAALSRHATSVLADPVYCFGQSIVTRALPGDVGVISGIEDLYYTPATSPVGFDTALRLKEGWDPAKLAALGADAAKLVVFHREDGDPAEVAHQHKVVAQAAADCHAVGLPLIVEPLWFPVAGESMDDPEVRERRRRSVISSARSFHDVGTDIMKVEFPVLDLTDLDAAHQACADLDEAIDGPWVLLSAGVTFEGFRTQIDVAADHGCSGFMAGRAIWGDAVGRLGAEQRAAGAALAARRLDELAEVLDGRGAPAWTPAPMADAASVIGPTWYRSYDTTGS
jgi:tagatose-1,6-bisphosphate aldolase